MADAIETLEAEVVDLEKEISAELKKKEAALAKAEPHRERLRELRTKIGPKVAALQKLREIDEPTLQILKG